MEVMTRVRTEFLPYALPDIGEEEIAEVVQTLQVGLDHHGTQDQGIRAAHGGLPRRETRHRRQLLYGRASCGPGRHRCWPRRRGHHLAADLLLHRQRRSSTWGAGPSLPISATT